MYIPKSYRIQDRDEISRWLSTVPFGVLVTSEGGRPMAVHMPFEWREEGERLVLEGHVARANPIWKVAPQAETVMAIFQGPHTYISSSWYHDPNVPTWNYVAIHVYGTCRILEGEEFRTSLHRMLDKYEAPRQDGRTWERLGDEFLRREMRAIVGIAIEVTEIQAAQKMSQNRQDGDFHHIVEQLQASSEASDHQVAEVMRTVRPQLFEPES